MAAHRVGFFGGQAWIDPGGLPITCSAPSSAGTESWSHRTEHDGRPAADGATWPSRRLHPVCIIAVFTAVVPIKEITARPATTASGPPAAGGRPPAAAPWSTAAVATLHCLTGCAIGEILGMVIGAAASLPNIATVAVAVALAFVFGYALTARGLLRAGTGLPAALRAALAADTASIAVMELTDNTIIAAIPGAMDAGLGAALFWASLAFSLIVAFVATMPLNRWLIGRGKGHALLHAQHH